MAYATPCSCHCQEKRDRSSSAEGQVAAAGLAEIRPREDLVCLRPQRGGLEHRRDGWNFLIVGYRTHRKGYWEEDARQKPVFHSDRQSMTLSNG
jgi:hypothetical protein